MFSRVKQLIRTPSVWVTLAGSVAVAVAALTCGSGCGHSSAQGESLLTEPQTLTVAVTNPKVETIRRGIVQPGWISSYEHTPIYAKLAGFVEDVKVDIGYKLKKDDLICKIYVPEVEADVDVKFKRVKQAEAELEQSKATFDVAKASVVTWDKTVIVAKEAYDRAKRIFDRWKNEVDTDTKSVEKGVLDKQTLDEAINQRAAADASMQETQFKLASAQASLNESEANRSAADADVGVKDAKLKVCQKDYDEESAWWGYHEIHAPYDGIITHRYVHTGHFVQPTNSGTTSKAAEPMFMFMRTDEMRIVIQVPESDESLIQDGQEAIVTVQALKDREIVGKVKRSSWNVNALARTRRVEVFLKNPTAELRAGMYANVTIMADKKNVMTLPVDAVQVEGDQNFVWVVEDGKAHRLIVHVGVQNSQLIELIEKQIPPKSKDEDPEWVKFTGNEKVIISNYASLSEGQALTVK